MFDRSFRWWVRGELSDAMLTEGLREEASGEGDCPSECRHANYTQSSALRIQHSEVLTCDDADGMCIYIFRDNCWGRFQKGLSGEDF